MNSLKVRLMDRQVRFMVASIAIVVALLVPAFVSAATVTERSISLSSSAKAATGVSHTVNFKAATNGTGAFIVDFCDTSVIGTACTPPVGFDTAGVTISPPGTDTVTVLDGNTISVELDTPVDAGEVANVVLTGFKNPTNSGALYARIVTYTDAAAAAGYTPANLNVAGNHLDSGSVALSITDSFGVSGSVLESLLFCASNSVITDNCGGPLAPPSIILGANGILDTVASEGTINSQISTNAASGAVVNLKSDAVGCGGLKRAGAPAACNITPLTAPSTTTIADNAAKFGMKLTGVSNGTGTITPQGNYGTSNYYLNYVVGDESGVTSTYGDPIFNTANAPISNGAVSLTFGANISNDTPAGAYSATLNLIATGKF